MTLKGPAAIDGGAASATDGRSLLFAYNDDTDTNVLRVPLGPAGRPVPPYDGTGTLGRDGKQWVVRLDASQVRAILDGRDGRAGLATPSDGTAAVVTWQASVPVAGSDGIAAYAYRLDAAGRPQYLSPWGPPSPNGCPPADLPAGVCVVIVPDSVPIAADRRSARQVAAVAVTPVALAGDAGLAVLAAPFAVVYVVISLTVSRHGFIWI